MSDSNKGAMTKADVILMKMDKLTQQMTSVEARVDEALKSSNTGSYSAIMKKIEEQGKVFKEEMHFLSAQLESVFSTIEKMMQKLSDEIAAIKVPENLSLDVDELSSRVAAKIIIPDNAPDIDEERLADAISSRIVVPEATLAEIDSDKLAEEISEKLTIPENMVVDIDSEKLADEIAAKLPAQQPTVVTAAAPVTATVGDIDYDALGFTVAKYLYVPQAVAEQFDYDEVAEKIAKKMPAPQVTASSEPATLADIDYDALGVTVAKNIFVPQAIAEEIDYDALAEKIADKMPAPKASAPVTATVADIDYDALGMSVAKNIYVPQAIAEEFDYDEIADRIAVKMPAPHVTAAVPAQAEVDYDLIAAKVAAAVSVQEAVSPDYIASKVAEQIIIPSQGNTEIDIEELSRKVADKIALPEISTNATVDEERLAYAISERLKDTETEEEVQPAQLDIDEHVLAEEIASRLNFSLSDELIADAVVKNLAGAIDSDEIADCVAKRVGTISPEQFEITVDDDGCDSLAKSVESKLDYDVIAASISEKLYPAFMSRGGVDDIDTEEIARQISEKITVGANINEDDIADKAAAVLSNYLPEIDVDDIADKVVAGVINSMPVPNVDSDEISTKVVDGVMLALSETPVVDGDELTYKVTEGVVAALSENTVVDTDAIADRVVEGVTSSMPDPIVDEQIIADRIIDAVTGAMPEPAAIDEEALAGRIIEGVSAAMPETAKIDDDMLSMKIVEGVMYALPETPIVDTEIIAFRVTEDVVSALTDMQLTDSEEIAKTVTEKVNDDNEERFAKVEEELEEIKRILESGVVVANEIAAEDEIAVADAEPVEEEPQPEEILVTVSELIGEEEAEPVVEEAPVEEVVEEAKEEEPEPVIEEDDIMEELDETPADGEILIDGDDLPDGVDFANMMKYNRSFIARIIQGTDEQKNNYGQVKTALLSYNKVNSNIAWGAERFNKGRETIARFKIRGKTLCLYLALDPNEFETSVYHHADVSDNKSMSGTPMMVKIKSPRGVKKAIRLIDIMLARRDGVKRHVAERDYAAMYPYETIDELIDDGLVKDVRKNK